MFVTDLPEAATVRVRGDSFEHQCRCTIGQWSVDNVGMTRDPAYISCTPVDVAILIVKHVLMCHRGIQNVATAGVQHAFRHSGGT